MTAEKKVNGQIAVILVRGLVGLNKKIKDTLSMLKLTSKNQCVVIEDNAVNRGMVKKVKDYTTWGEVDEKVLADLVSKKGRETVRLTDINKKYTYKCFEFKGKKYLPYFCLNPPRKGFGRKGIKMPFKLGGALGNREEKINDLIMRML